MWTIQKIISKGDYNYALVPDHPNATKNGYVLEHRVVVENDLDRLLSDDEIVHHKDGNRKNNTRGNLEVMFLADHSRFHGLLQGTKMVDCKCPSCGTLFTREYRQTFLSKKKGKFVFCSRNCSGEFWAIVRSSGNVYDFKPEMNNNIIRIYRSD